MEEANYKPTEEEFYRREGDYIYIKCTYRGKERETKILLDDNGIDFLITMCNKYCHKMNIIEDELIKLLTSLV